MSKTVVFVDDDRRLVRQYAEHVEECGFRTAEFYGVDDVLAYLREGRPADAIVWDMMMVPGKEFEGKEHNGGFSTGVLLYAELKKLRPAARFILLTNKDDTAASFRGEPLTIRMKTETSPEDLAELLQTLFPAESSGGAP
jgi:DNA-binding NtrC family response regulator